MFWDQLNNFSASFLESSISLKNLFSFNRKYLEVKIWAQGVLIAADVSWLLDHFEGQIQGL